MRSARCAWSRLHPGAAHLSAELVAFHWVTRARISISHILLRSAVVIRARANRPVNAQSVPLTQTGASSQNKKKQLAHRRRRIFIPGQEYSVGHCQRVQCPPNASASASISFLSPLATVWLAPPSRHWLTLFDSFWLYCSFFPFDGDSRAQCTPA